MSKLFQIHWQLKDGTTEMKAQGDFASIKEMRDFLKEVKAAHPLPKGAMWMMCNSKSKHFVWTKGVEDVKDRL